MKHFDDTFLTEMQDALEEEGYRIEQQLNTLGKKNTDGDWMGTSEESGEEADSSDAADNIEEMTTNVAVVEELEAREREIVDALERLEDATYGICESCGEPIDTDRLRANPAASTCIEHAA